MRIIGYLQNYRFELASLLIGAVSFLLIFGEILNPTYVDWIIMDGMDTYQHYYAWEFYRHQTIGYPLGIIQNIAPPIGIPLVYMDAIPIFAIILAPLSPFLPTEFQFFGIFLLLSFMLIGYWAYTLISHFTKDKLLSIFGSAFFVFSPIMIYRAGGHTSLTAHWLILAAFYLTLFPFKTVYWLGLQLLAFLIHPYLFLIIAPIMLAHLIHNTFWRNETNIKETVISLAVQLATILFTAYSVGLWHIYSSKSQGFGEYSFNLNGFWNPYWGDWSRVLPNLSTGPYQFEGFAYLGLGVIFLIIVNLILSSKKLTLQKVKGNITNYLPFYILGLFFFLYAVSSPALFGTFTIYDFNEPPIWLEQILNIARGSGRFIWPIYYIIFLVAISSLKYIKVPWRYIIIVSALVIQLYDTSYHIWDFQNNRHENKVWNHELTPVLETYGKRYEHINFFPIFPWYDGQLSEEDYSAYFEFAKNNNLTVNSALTARIVKGGNKHIKAQIEELESGVINANTIYVILDERNELLKYFEAVDHTKIDRPRATIVFPKQTTELTD